MRLLTFSCLNEVRFTVCQGRDGARPSLSRAVGRAPSHRCEHPRALLKLTRRSASVEKPRPENSFFDGIGGYAVGAGPARGGLSAIPPLRVRRVTDEGRGRARVNRKSETTQSRRRPLSSRELNAHVHQEIVRALGGRSWAWLARESGVPQSTLADQARVGRFSLYVLIQVAQALGRHLYHFLPPEVLPGTLGDPGFLLDQLRHHISPRSDRPDG